MKSNKQRKSEIKQRRWKRMEAQREVAQPKSMPAGVLAADMECLALVHGPYFWHKGYYEDCAYRCRDCGAYGVWSARDQKWWYEQAQGCLDSRASRCKSCRTEYRAWRQSHCHAPEMEILRKLWRDRPDCAARDRVEQGLVAKDPALRSLAAQALAWWWYQFDDEASHERLEDVELEKSWAPRIHRILKGELELRPGVQRVCRVERLQQACF